jgi:hypothetical protein
MHFYGNRYVCKKTKIENWNTLKYKFAKFIQFFVKDVGFGLGSGSGSAGQADRNRQTDADVTKKSSSLNIYEIS